MLAAIAVAAALLSSPAHDVLAYSAAGDRLFPATLVLPQIAPGDEFYVNHFSMPLRGGQPGMTSHINNLTLTYTKTLTERLGFVVDETWTRLDLAGGTGAQRVGASPSGATTPTVFFGKGLGDLDVGHLRPLALAGLVGYQVADRPPRPNLETGGFVVEYSMPYLRSKVENLDLPEWLRNLTPMTELAITTPGGKSFGARTTMLVAPGVSYAGDGWELAAEALIPLTRASGRGIGVTAQIHFSLDYLFAETIGRPLFSAP